MLSLLQDGANGVELLDGKGIDYPAIMGGNVTFKKARRAAEDQGEQLSL